MRYIKIVLFSLVLVLIGQYVIKSIYASATVSATVLPHMEFKIIDDTMYITTNSPVVVNGNPVTK